MDFLSGLAKGGETKPTSDEPKKADHHEDSSTSDLFGSAKVVADAAQAQFRGEQKCDKAKVSAAGADLLHAASDYGKLDETKGIGKYVDQAEDYLRQSSGKSTPAAAAPTGDSGEHKPTTTEAEKPSGGGAGDYVKMAEGFLNKPSGESGEKTEASSEGGYGDMMKMAGGFLKK